MPNRLDPPKPISAGDVAHAATKGGLGMIPIAGSVLAEFFGLFVTPPLTRRLEAWMAEIAATMKRLQDQRAISWTELADDQGFLSTLVQATEAARRTHEREKLDALRNAVANTALPHPPDESLRALFVRWADEFTVWHLRVMTVLDEKDAWFTSRSRPSPLSWRQTGSTLSGPVDQVGAVVAHAYPEMDRRMEFGAVILADFEARKLFKRRVDWTMSIEGVWTSEIGKAFLGFISKPSELAGALVE